MPFAARNFCKIPSNRPGPSFYPIDKCRKCGGYIHGICGEKDPELDDDCKSVCEGQCVVQQQVAGANGTGASPSIKVPWEDPKTTLNFYPINSEHLRIQYHKYRDLVQNDCGEGCTVRTARGCKVPLRWVVLKREEERQRQTGKPFSTLGLNAILSLDVSAMVEAGDRRLVLLVRGRA